MHQPTQPAGLREVATPVANTSFGRGDRIAAARDMETTHGLYIPMGSTGTIAEDRGSTLVVFFHHQTPPTNLQESDLRN
jgi:hypothetical protein